MHPYRHVVIDEWQQLFHGRRTDLDKRVHDLCASVQAAIVEVLVKKTIRAAERIDVGCVTVSGGVACNSALRTQLTNECQKRGIKIRLAEKKFSTDNAAMIGILAERKLLAGIEPTALDADIQPSWQLQS